MRRMKGLLAAWLGGAVCASGALGDPLDDKIRDYFDVERYAVDSLVLPAELPVGGFDVFAEIGGRDLVLSLEPVSLRSDDFRVLLDDGTGELREVDAPAPRTFEGYVEGVPGSLVVGSLLGDGLSVMIELPVGGEIEKWFIQPLSEADGGQDPSLHVVYLGDDQVWPDGAFCPVEGGPLHNHDQLGGGDLNPADPLWNCEIAFDCDNDYYNARGQNENTVIGDVENVMNVVRVTYERDIQITYTITEFIIRTSRVYTTTDPGQLLGQFQSRWNNAHRNVHRDIAHLMTGKNINGGVIGIAFLSVICSQTQGYGLSQTTFTGSMNFRAALTAHELGHNWSARHCNGINPCNIMCASINGCNGIGNPIRFAPVSISRIAQFRNLRGCLNIINDGTLDLPFFDDFPSSDIDEEKWPLDGRNGASTGFIGGEPSSPWALVLDGTDHITTAPLLADGASDLVVSFFAAQIAVENCEALVVEYLEDGGGFVEMGRVTAGEDILLPYQQFGFLAPNGASYDGVEFRLRAAGSDGGDDWFIDDVLIEANGNVPPAPSISLPLFHTFACDEFDASVWGNVSAGAAVNSDGVNEPSAPFSLELTGSERAQTLSMNAAGFGQVPLYLNFMMEERNLENGDALLIQYENNVGSTITVGVIVSAGGSQNNYSLFEFELSGDAIHDELKVRFQAAGSSSDDTWYIDDIGVSEVSLIGDGCDADLDGDGDADADDFFAYLDAFAVGDLDVCDIDGDGDCDADDFFDYLDLFAQGC